MIEIRPMRTEDVDLGMHLREQAGWNQTRADWERFLYLEPEGCFVAKLDSQPVGTLATFVFDHVAWIAMVLVEREARGQGVGTRLMQHALESLDQRAIATVRLDATPLGEPLYKKLGFQREYELARFEGKPGMQTSRPSATSNLVQPDDRWFAAACKLDAEITATSRNRLLRRLRSEFPEALRVYLHESGILGSAMWRPGSKTWFVGPVVALRPEAGRALCDEVVQILCGERIFIDIPLKNSAAIDWAKERGLTIQRSLVRMSRGPTINDRPPQIWASSGPEKG